MPPMSTNVLSMSQSTRRGEGGRGTGWHSYQVSVNAVELSACRREPWGTVESRPCRWGADGAGFEVETPAVSASAGGGLVDRSSQPRSPRRRTARRRHGHPDLRHRCSGRRKWITCVASLVSHQPKTCQKQKNLSETGQT